ncbi:MAG: hypothetical protein ACJAR2_000871 [Ilumatobacter sp.]
MFVYNGHTSRAAIEQNVDLCPAALEARLRGLFEQQRRLDTDITAALAVVDQREDFRADGHRSTHAFVKATINCDGGQAARLVRRARSVNHHPAVGNALAAARIGTAQADRLARAAQHRRAGHRFGEFVDQLLGHAEHLEYPDFDTVVSRFEMFADMEGAFGDDEFQFGERSAKVVAVGSGVSVTAHGGAPLQAAEMIAVFKLAEQREFDRDYKARKTEHGDAAQDHPLPRTTQQRKFDAMHSIFMAYVTKSANGVLPEPLVNIVIDPLTAGELLHDHGLTDTAAVFTDGKSDDLAHRRCETSTGVVVHSDIALQALLTGHVRRVVVDAAGVITDMGRRTRLFTGRMRDAAQLLVRTCSFNGCSVPAEFCEVDHLTEFSRGGKTEVGNGGPECGSHNRYKHRAKLTAKRAIDGRIRLIRPDGKVIKPVGERDPEWADPDPPRTNIFDPKYLVPWAEFIANCTCPDLVSNFEMPVSIIPYADLV